MSVGSSWEAALTLASLLEVMEHEELGTVVENEWPDAHSKVMEIARWLIERCEYHEDGSVCWDHSAWDTAVVTDALISFASAHFVKPESTLGAQGARAVAGALQWLTSRYTDYASGRPQHLLNVADVARFGDVLLDAVQEDRRRTDLAVKAGGWETDAKDLLRFISVSVIRRSSQRPLSVATTDEADQQMGVWWDDWFATADVMSFLVSLVSAWNELGLRAEEVTRQEIVEKLVQCVVLIEDCQSDGMWGSFVDTILMLDAYSKVENSSAGGNFYGGRLLARPSVVFRAARWACDRSMIFADGSCLHTGFLTTFFVQAVLHTGKYWPFAEMRLLDLYDELSMLTGKGCSQDRADYLDVIARLDKTARSLEVKRQEVRTLAAAGRDNKWLIKRIYFTIVLVLLTAAGIGATFVSSGLLRVTVESANPSLLIAVLSVVLAVLVGVVTIVWTMVRHSDSPASSEATAEYETGGFVRRRIF